MLITREATQTDCTCRPRRMVQRMGRSVPETNRKCPTPSAPQHQPSPRRNPQRLRQTHLSAPRPPQRSSRFQRHAGRLAADSDEQVMPTDGRMGDKIDIGRRDP